VVIPTADHCKPQAVVADKSLFGFLTGLKVDLNASLVRQRHRPSTTARRSVPDSRPSSTCQRPGLERFWSMAAKSGGAERGPDPYEPVNLARCLNHFPAKS